MDSLISALSKLFTQAYEQGLADGRKQPVIEHVIVSREDMPKMFNFSKDTFDDYFRYKNDFPKPLIGNTKWYAPAVHEWLMDHSRNN
ncbi:hypothetical protein AVR82_14580 [Lactiplantibacillus plantarum]|nr:hypothetical protein AVR82_14580 [Lactiplantibacillus plantarum]AOB21447.1 hypothetical protein AVR83_00175 [Lactiplantibacillus plantarum]ASZ33112.1 hypothetical protein CLC99_07480 [Lactiplantibacillus plantarum]GFF01250.1 hypothetical protein DmLsi_30530 [Lactiplantibacillus plantarum]